MGSIEWTSFSWEAFATLATGAMAVLAASFVGWRQVKIAAEQVAIASRQTGIMGQQADLAELQLRQSVFDRRIAVYDATTLFISAQVTLIEQQELREGPFLEAMARSQFLFKPDVYEDLKDIWKWSLQLRATRSRIAQRQWHDEGSTEVYLDREQAAIDKLNGYLAALPQLFDEASLRLVPSSQRLRDSTPGT